MSVISTIRKNSWILVVTIGLALAAFIAMDMTSQGGQLGGQDTTLGSVNGSDLDYFKFSNDLQILYGNSNTDTYANVNSLWNTWVNQQLVAQEAERLGLGVSEAELIELQFGNNLSPIISQRFRDPNTDQINRQRLNEIKTAIENGTFTEPNYRAFWKYQQEEVATQRLQDKIRSMVSKGLYIPTWQAEMANKEKNEKVAFNYVKVPFDEIDNTQIAVSDSDYKDYIKENAYLYEQEEETRIVEYVSFEVSPSSEDSTYWREEVNRLIPELDSTREDSLFIVANRGVFDPAYIKADAVTGVAADTIKNMAAGQVYGPYFEEGTYKAVKVIDRMIIPDSVRSRHILRPAQTQEEFIATNKLIDSLKNVIESGNNTFAALAEQFGTDATRTKGGDLDYAGPGTMVKPFNDLIFYKAEIGKLYKVVTQFGIHLVEVTDKRFINNDEGYKLGYLTQKVIPTDKTQQQYRAKALKFLSNNRSLDAMRNAAADMGMETNTSPSLKRNDYTFNPLGGGEGTRAMVKWAFEQARVGEVSSELFDYRDPIEYFDNKYVVAGLRSVQPPGLPSVDNIRFEIEIPVINKKKGDMLKEKMTGKSLSALVSEFDTKVDTANNVAFSATFIPKLGAEPKVIAEAFMMDTGSVSQPIVGKTGVFVVKVTNKMPAPPATNIPEVRRNLSATKRAQVSSSIIKGLKDNAKIVDNRATFY